MPDRKKPPAAAIAVAGLIALVSLVAILNRVRDRERAEEQAAADVARQPSALEQAFAFEDAGHPEAAATILRPHLAQNPDDLDALQLLRRVLPPADKSELAWWLAKSTRADELFEELYGDARGEGDAAGQKALLVWLRVYRPNDHRGVCAEIEELVRARKFADATDLFRARVETAATPAARSQILVSFVHAMRAAEQSLAAYAAVPDDQTAIAMATLAQPLENRLLTKFPNGPGLGEAKKLHRELVAAHRKRAPGTSSLAYHEGVLLQSDGEFEKAEKRYAEGQAKLTPPPNPVEPATYPRPGDWAWDHEMFRIRRVECLYKLNQTMKAYAEVGPAEDTFRQLAFALLEDKKADGLAELVAAHKDKFPKAPEVVYWEGEVQFVRGEYAKAATAFQAFEAGPQTQGPERWRVTDRLIRAHLRAGNAAAARNVMDAARADRVQSPVRAAVLAATGDAEGLEAFLAHHAALQTGGLHRLYADEDFAREIAADRHAELRKKYPDPRTKAKGPNE